MCGIVCICEVIIVFANERQNIIYKMLKADGAVTCQALTEKFGVSIETIRRDLLSMESEKLLKRVHGGAVCTDNTSPAFSFVIRHQENTELKKELCGLAMSFIEEGDCIFVDPGSTAVFFSNELKKNFKSLTIVTNSSDVFDILSRYEDYSVILAGGHFDKRENAFYGFLCAETLSKLHCDKAFIFPNAVSEKGGIGVCLNESYDTQKVIMANSDKVYILFDSTKYNGKSLIKLDDIKKEYIYISDSHFDKEIKRYYSEKGIRIYTERSDIK